MKKAFFVIGMIGSVIVTFNSCAVGSFKTLNACWDFNNSVSSNKYLNAIIGFILIPFEVTIGGFCDVVIFNSVEFWTGSNPLAATKIVHGNDGTDYAISPMKGGGYMIKNLATNAKMELQFEASTRTWTAVTENVSVKLFSLVDDSHAIVYLPTGESMEVALTEEGIMAYKEASSSTSLITD